MPELSAQGHLQLIQVTADLMRLVQLDDAWTAAVTISAEPAAARNR